MSSSRRSDAIALVVLAALVTLFFTDVLLGINALYVADLAHYSYPLKKLLRDVVLGGEFPYWNRFVSAGQPMAANPAHEVFYPLTWLILLPSYDLGFRLFVLIHLYIAAFGMYALLRSMDLRPPAAFFGALSFAIGGICLSLLSLLPFLASVVWIPLICLFARRFVLHRRLHDFAFAAMFLGLQLLVGEPVIPLQTGLLLGLFALASTRKLRALASIALIAVVATLLAAVTILPAIDHASDSVRAFGFPFEIVTNWSMPFARIGELFSPSLFDSESLARLYPDRRTPFYPSLYSGLLVAMLACAGFVMRMRGWTLVIGTFALSVFLAAGNHTPLWRFLYDFGVVRSIRYPEKFIAFGVFALIVFAAHAFDRLLGVRKVLAAALLIFAVVDLGIRVPKVAPRVPASYFEEPPLIERQLPRNRTEWRLFHMASLTRKTVGPYMRPHPDLYWMHRNAMYPMMPARWGIQTVMELDYDLTTLQPTAALLNAAQSLSHLRPDWVQVVAAMGNARYVAVFVEPAEAFARAKNDRKVLQPVRLVEVPLMPRYRFADRVETLRDVAQLDGRTAFIPPSPLSPPAGRGWRAAPGEGLSRGIVHRVHETANTARLDVETAGRAFLVMSVTPHKYWTITIDGEEAPTIVTNIGYQGVIVPTAGRHVIEMRYRNPLIVAGAAISLGTLLALCYVALRPARPAALIAQGSLRSFA